MIRQSSVGRRRQRGAALLVLMLLLIVAAAYAMLTRLTALNNSAERRETTALALAQAKEALLGYAAAYPELVNSDYGPGYLPCPDTTDSGSPVGSCAMNSAATGIGLLPWRYLGLPDLRDAAGERLWYAVDDNHRYQNYHQPLNSDTPGQLTLDTNKTDIVAVIIAPGPPVNGQTRAGGPVTTNVANYLEGDNANTNNSNFVSTPATDLNGDGVIDEQDMNDTVAVITRAELMAVVEKRVMGTVANALIGYRGGTAGNPATMNPSSRFPRPTPFADPKLVTAALTGTATTGSAALQLVDSAHDFTRWHLRTDSPVRDLSDGSVGPVIGTVAANSLSVSSLAAGTHNVFAVGDSYVLPLAYPDPLTGTAQAGSSGLTLTDTGAMFVESGVAEGDVIDNTTDGSHGLITSAAATSLSAGSLVDGAANTFNAGDAYAVRTDMGTATGGTLGSLTDSKVNFQTLGIQTNDALENLTTGTVGNVQGVSAHLLNTSIAFSSGDVYRLPRFDMPTSSTVSDGLVPVNEIDKPYPSGFTVVWNNSLTPALSYQGAPASASVPIAYLNSLATLAANGYFYVPARNGTCLGMSSDQANCIATGQLTGTASSTTQLTYLADPALSHPSEDFNAWGVGRGDRIVNSAATNGYGIVNTVTSATTLNAYTGANLTTGSHYHVQIATEILISTVSQASAGINIIADTSTKPSTALQGDVLVDLGNPATNPGGFQPSYGLITSAPHHDPVQGWIMTYSTLQGGTNTAFVAGDQYEIRRGWVDRREWRFRSNGRGTPLITYAASGERLRSLKVAAPAAPPYPTVEITDYDPSGTELGQATINVSSGSLAFSNIDFDLLIGNETGADLPRWFANDNWQRFMFFAVAPGFLPGGAGACTPGTDCLILDDNSLSPAAQRRNDIQAMVISMGTGLSSQDRSLGCLPAPASCIKDQVSPPVASLLSQYLEGGNQNNAAAVQPHTYYEGTPTSTFNDRVRIVSCSTNSPSPCP